MPLVAAAVCPHPPLLVPELAGAAAGELDDLRAACAAAVARLYDSAAQTVLVLGAESRSAVLAHPYRGSFAPWGVPLEVRLGAAGGTAGTDRLPLSLLVGAWLLGRATDRRPVTYRMATVADGESVSGCREFGERLGGDRPWALLVMGDGSACRGEKAPGYHDPRAEAYDSGVARALAGADTEALLGLDPQVSAELRTAGRAPWQVLAGAARAAGGDWRGELIYDAAPYGVAYFVASWERA
ncbi:hypothetical protein C1I99_09880 [Micromonospora deserti]|uniref:Catalytic LigB subunit of aromatic ring-opening dioxygenase n=1 Tax=Micromonospora deserti TaxID=2070366 RepID=A0A2W2CNZ0_9ACTN|nr:class III extradiol dioxygenase subunit B-like domain-containing protein [Micromonospora deserti]PZG00313.1 hypothetical protein C1I99_09880 [Micromonospora deserti]